MSTVNRIDKRSHLGGQDSFKIKKINADFLANILFKKKTVVPMMLICSSQSLVNRVAEYIIGGETIINDMRAPF